MKTIAALIAVIAAAVTGIIIMSSSEPEAPVVARTQGAPEKHEAVQAKPAKAAPPSTMGIRTRPQLAENSVIPADQTGEERTARRRLRQERRARYIERFDADGDGEISAEERLGMRKARRDRRQQRAIERFDDNGDGQLDDEERATMDEARQQRRVERRTRMMNRVDADSDGSITPDELDQGGRRIRRFVGDFDTADTNGDGKIDDGELERAYDAQRQRWRQRRSERAGRRRGSDDATE